jgi:hypothetical protein
VPADPSFFSQLQAKITQCKLRCNFESPGADLEAKQLKLRDLQDIHDVIQSGEISLKDVHIVAILDLVSANLCRPLGDYNPRLLVPESTPPADDPAWPHLKIVYEILNRLLEKAPNSKHFRVPFLQRVLGQIGSPSMAEREAIAHFVLLCARLQTVSDGVIISLLERALLVWEGTTSLMFATHCALVTFYIFTRMHGAPGRGFFDRVVLPSVASPRFGFYCVPFTETVAVVSNTFPDAARDAVVVLLRYYWTNVPAKQCAIIKAITALFPRIVDEVGLMQKIAPVVVDALASATSRAVGAALDFVSLPAFAGSVAIPGATQFLQRIVPTIAVVAREYWAPEVQVRAAVVLEALAGMSERVRALQDTRPDGREAERRSTWVRIAGAADEPEALAMMEARCEEPG